MTDKVSPSDRFFHIVPNEHIQTLLHNEPGKNSFDNILNLASTDSKFKKNMLLYLKMMKDDAINFAKDELNFMPHYINGSSRFYGSKDDQGVGSLYIVVHNEANGEPHLHLHYYINGNNDGFSLSDQITRKNGKLFTPIIDLFGINGQNNISMSLDHFAKIISNA